MTTVKYADTLVDVETARRKLGVDQRTMEGLLNRHFLVRYVYMCDGQCIELISQLSVTLLTVVADRARRAHERGGG